MNVKAIWQKIMVNGDIWKAKEGIILVRLGGNVNSRWIQLTNFITEEKDKSSKNK